MRCRRGVSSSLLVAACSLRCWRVGGYISRRLRWRLRWRVGGCRCRRVGRSWSRRWSVRGIGRWGRRAWTHRHGRRPRRGRACRQRRARRWRRRVWASRDRWRLRKDGRPGGHRFIRRIVCECGRGRPVRPKPQHSVRASQAESAEDRDHQQYRRKRNEQRRRGRSARALSGSGVARRGLAAAAIPLLTTVAPLLAT